jgi:hypothetical protein
MFDANLDRSCRASLQSLPSKTGPHIGVVSIFACICGFAGPIAVALFRNSSRNASLGHHLTLIPIGPMADDVHCGLPHRRRGRFVATFFQRGSTMRLWESPCTSSRC